MLLLYPNTASGCNKACLQTGSTHHSSLTTSPVRNWDRWLRYRGSLRGVCSFASCLLDEDWNEAMKVTEKEQLRGNTHLNPIAHSQSPTERAPGKSGLRKRQVPKSLKLSVTQQNWARDLPSEESPRILLLLSKLWQESPQIPSPHPKKLLRTNDLWIAFKKKKTKTKNQLYNSRLLLFQITAKYNPLIYK